MSKPSSRSDPAEFEFELDIGEGAAPAPSRPAKPKDEVPGSDEDPGGDYVILKRKARKPKAGDGVNAPVEGSATAGSETGKGGFKPKRLDGELVVVPPARVASPPGKGVAPRERPGLEGIGRAKDSRNRMAVTTDKRILRAIAAMRPAGGSLSGLVHLRNNKTALAIILTVMIVGLVIWLLPSGPEEEVVTKPDAQLEKAAAGLIGEVEPIAGGDSSREGAALLLKSQVGESDAQRNLRARDTLEKFFQAKDPAGMSAFIRDPQRVKPLIEDYYSRHPFAMPGVSEIARFQEIMINLKVFLVADIVLEGKGASSVVLQDAGNGFVVDWETYVCYNPMDWEEFYSKRPIGAMSLRVLATLDHNPGFAFPGEAEWVCVRLIGRDSDEELYGYARTGSQTALRIQEMLEDEWEFPCILQLQFPEDGKGGDRQVHIKDLVMENWIRVE